MLGLWIAPPPSILCTCFQVWLVWSHYKSKCGGVWAVYPVVFSISYTLGIVHSILTVILAAATVSTFCLSSFRCAGTPPTVFWGSYPVVGKGDLDNYTFCHHCSKPKSPRAHHCNSCRTCVLDMDHHCPFIGNCVGASNHRHFIAFLFAAIFSTVYVSIMSTYAGLHIWPPVKYRSIGHLNGFSSHIATTKAFKEVIIAFASSSVQLSARGLVLVYLFISSVSLQIGLGVLLWQQLSYIYEGKTYVGHLSSQASGGGDHIEEKDCQNILRFFGCPYSISRYFPGLRNSPKRHTK
ncbi:protein S-acyltransferase 11-like isoform X2 [Hibiscus syriacus]|uniref:protein S-acyltransferase 11-like isoform X2 n=1 Tax=Hibiscus syriacus TaxID=106335 RepID=UPI0019218CFD|nr:protein S-acyltransferase 11-like isoform X2 [Hibiscus syriacus]